eukprot:m.119557 g.119557  ORF g.119557 m.119557 type:complete len:682 (-) comp15597_c0_seq10:121-2166(-)
MTWTLSDWEPWLVFAVCLLATSIVTAAVLYLCHRRSQRHRLNKVDVLNLDGQSNHRSHTMTNNGMFATSRLATSNANSLLVLPRAAIHLTKRLSDGRFGQRHAAILTEHKHASTLYTRGVQVEQLDSSKFTHAEAAFEYEATMCARLHHRNVVRLVGQVTTLPLWLVYEGIPYGTVHEVLVKHREAGAQLDLSEVVLLMGQLASALAYMHAEGFAHHAVMASSCQLGRRNRLSLGDFSAGWQVTNRNTTPVAKQRLPIYRHLAPEVMLRWAQATGPEADVWAFGMTIIELCLQATEPLMQDIRRDQLLARLQDGYRPSMPSLCTDDLYTLAQQCWQAIPSDRPPMSLVETQLRDMAAALDALESPEYREIGVIGKAHRRVTPAKVSGGRSDPYSMIDDGSPAPASTRGRKAYDPYETLGDVMPAAAAQAAPLDPEDIEEAKRQAEATALYSQVNKVRPSATSQTPDKGAFGPQDPPLPNRGYRRILSTPQEMQHFFKDPVPAATDPAATDHVPATVAPAPLTPKRTTLPSSTSTPATPVGHQRRSSVAQLAKQQRDPSAAPWLHQSASRRDAQAALMSRGMAPGLFLIRPSKDSGYVLMVADGSEYHTYRIGVQSQDGTRHFSLDGGETQFPSLRALVDYYSSGQVGAAQLKNPLRIPCTTTTAYKEPSVAINMPFEEAEV